MGTLKYVHIRKIYRIETTGKDLRHLLSAMTEETGAPTDGRTK